jgi:hypothetical protein
MAEQTLDIPLDAPKLRPTLELTHINLEVTPNDDRRLGYGMALPRTWAFSSEFGPVPTGLFQSSGLGFATGSADADAAVIAVTVTSVPFEVPVDAWLRASMAAEGWQVEQAQWFPGPNGVFFDVTAQRVVEERVEVRRSSARVDGNLIFCVNCMCARRHWDAAKEVFWIAHVTFALLSGSGSTRMELWGQARAEAPRFALAYPTSWSAEVAEPDAEGVSGVHLRLVDAKVTTLLSYLQVLAIEEDAARPAELAALLAASLERLRKAGVAPIPPERPTPESEDPRSIGVPGFLGDFSGRARMGDAEVATRLSYVRRANVVVSFCLLSPTSADDQLTSFRAQRALEIARSTLRVEPGSEQ